MSYDLEIDKNLEKLVSGKRVVVVGPAPHLVGKSLGSEIDKFDIIVRLNEVIPPKNHRVDYGSRTDIMFHNLGDKSMEGLIPKVSRDEDSFLGLKMVVCAATKSNHEDHNFLNHPLDHVSGVVKNFYSLGYPGIPFYWIGHKNYRSIYKFFEKKPHTGAAAICVLAKYPLKELHLTGLTFHATGDTCEQLYRDGHWEEVELANKPETGWYGGFHHGSTLEQMEKVISVVTNSDFITTDEKLQELGFPK